MYSIVKKVLSAKTTVSREERQLSLDVRSGVLRKMMKSALMTFNATLNTATMKPKNVLKGTRKV